MSEEQKCPQCGVALAAQSPQGLCPGCLLKWGLESQTGVAEGTAADRPPPTPAELAAHFPDLEILELVGCGGMGVVYMARQKQLDRLVALKILSPKIGQDPAFAERFAREARAMALLSHPHIVAVYDSGQTDGLYYFLMEFVDGVSLRQLLDAGTLSPEEALAIVPQICEALQFAHDHGVVHRDIKPENILLDKCGQVKIADFGLAKLIGREAKDLGFSLTGVGQVMGTPHYMAPEQLEHPQAVDHRADIYSLGVVFYQMLTGELPLGRFAPPSRKVQIDVRLDEVVLRALEKEPERRYQQASEIRTEVETIATTFGTGTSPPAYGIGAAMKPSATSRQSQMGIIALVCALAAPASGMAIGPVNPAVAMILAFGLEMTAIILGILAWKSRIGKAAVIVAALVPVLMYAMFMIARMRMGPPETVLRLGRPAPPVSMDAARHVGGPWACLLPGGGSVELVGVGEEGGRLWRPDGSPYVGQPIDLHLGLDKKKEERIVVFRLPADATIDMRESEPTASWPASIKRVVAGSVLPNYQFFVGKFSKSLNKASLRVAVAAGKWDTIATFSGGAVESMEGVRIGNVRGSVLFTPTIQESDGDTVGNLVYTKTEDDVRVVAVDQAGQEHPAASVKTVPFGSTTHLTVRFPSEPGNQMVRFRFQVRLRQSIEFRNVAMQRATDGTAAGRSSQPPDRQPDTKSDDWKAIDAGQEKRHPPDRRLGNPGSAVGDATGGMSPRARHTAWSDDEAATSRGVTKPLTLWGAWNAGWSVRLRHDKTTWSAGDMPEFMIDVRTREGQGSEPDVVHQSLHNWLLEVDGRRFRLGLFTTSWEHNRVFEPGTVCDGFVTFRFHRDDSGLHVRTGDNGRWINSYRLDPVGQDGHVLSHSKPQDRFRWLPGKHVVRIGFPLKHDPTAGYTEADLAHFAFSNPVEVQIERAASAAAAKEGDFPYAMTFEQGATRFLDGDKITILEVRGTADTFSPGNSYRIRGTYSLASHDRAMLAAYTTAKDAANGTGPSLTVQTMGVTHGSGAFTLVLPMSCPAWPHVSFYPADGGDSFGGNYFGTGDSVLKRWWGQAVEKPATNNGEGSERSQQR